ncbi:3-hydroxyacyl-ACP dehydratase FabZ family protein [Streptomyces sp. H39-S7]|uniref:3-hydroxyacyl-ACP dehydratase FabZ family protein n=1 Tax=Streptomyces sp. H39-S7 TaxID=3004357 RepID=UPI0022B06985|nr:hypothetical protein [Streptomyces sp. H39-S7]MCZ4123123.1 hypothetical protein [Streptomyces sp. H39-S7]
MTTAISTSPVAGAVHVLRPAGPSGDGPALRSRAEVRIEESEPVFAGHYPGFPIFPGVCVVECVHRAALATAPQGESDLSLTVLDSARFVGAVFPGDVLAVDIKWTATDDGWKCVAQASGSRGVAANVRLRYRTGAST